MNINFNNTLSNVNNQAPNTLYDELKMNGGNNIRSLGEVAPQFDLSYISRGAPNKAFDIERQNKKTNLKSDGFTNFTNQIKTLANSLKLDFGNRETGGKFTLNPIKARLDYEKTVSQDVTLRAGVKEKGGEPFYNIGIKVKL